MHDGLMREAFSLARKGRGLASPNPMVGAVLARDGEIAGRGFHTYAGVRHAEIAALEQAGERARGATLYITLEPCAHYGRTPPCAEALIAAGVARVVAAAEDPNPLTAGAGFRRLREAGVAVEIAADFTAEAEKLNQPFFHFMRTGRPLVTLKAAMTLDGKISAAADHSGWITSERARAHVQELRHDHDAILTGIGTALADDPLLTDRTGLPRARPLLRIVMDSQLRLPLDSRLVRSAASDLLVVASHSGSRRRELEEGGAEVLIAAGSDGRADAGAVIRRLAERKYLSLMIEGGSGINASALEGGWADRVFLYYALKIIGGREAAPLAGGPGRARREDAIRLHNLTLHPIPPDEFAVEAWLDAPER